MSLGLKGLRLVHTYNTNISTSASKAQGKVCVNRDAASIGASLTKKGTFLFFLCLYCYVIRVNRGAASTSTREKEELFC